MGVQENPSHLDVVNGSVYIYEIMIISWRERKVDRLKMNPRGATNLYGANARPTDELTLARGGGGEQRG